MSAIPSDVHTKKIDTGAYRYILPGTGLSVFVVCLENTMWAMYDDSMDGKLVYRRYPKFTAAADAARAYLTDANYRSVCLESGIVL